MIENSAILREKGAIRPALLASSGDEDRDLICNALGHLIGGTLAAPGGFGVRGPLLWKVLLLRAMVVRESRDIDAGEVLRIGILGNALCMARGDGIAGLSECDQPCGVCAADLRLARVEKTIVTIEGKVDELLKRLGGGAAAESASAGAPDLTRSVRNLGELVARSLREGDRLRRDDAYKAQVIDEMSEGADKFLSGVVGRMETPAERDLFFLLIHRADVNGVRRALTYEQIGKRLGGVTKQAAHARARDFQAKYPEAWQYVMSIRRPGRADNFSELSPSDRRKHGIDKAYNYDAG